jgi:hypothetical protein
MRISFAILASVLALATITRAGEPGHLLPEATITRAGEPDHLLPVAPYEGGQLARYSKQLNSHLKLEAAVFAQLVVRPSFDPELVVRLHGKKGDNDFDSTSQFFLTYSVADKNIWYSMSENGRGKKSDKVKVSTITTEIPKPLAIRIERLWEQMLLRTRYREQDVRSSGDRVIGTDGTTFEFSAWNAYGETWSPEERLSPLLFVELGASLVDYCKATSGDRPAAAKEIENKAAQLEQYLNEHPSK